jgi:hypothetical protein
MNELIGLAIGLTLTLFIYSYIFIGDQIPYKLAIHILVGVSAAYALVIVVREVILPIVEQLRQDPSQTELTYWLIPAFFVILLLMRRLKVVNWLGNNTLALLTGVGAAVALVGALTGTLWPQVTTAQADNRFWGIIIAFFTICTLLTFQFTTFRSRIDKWEQAGWRRLLNTIGRIVLTITFGALFANVLGTSFILLADRLSFFLTELMN